MSGNTMRHTPILITLCLAATAHAQNPGPFTAEQAAAGLIARIQAVLFRTLVIRR